MMLAMKDLEYQLRESQTQTQQVQKLNQLFKDEIAKEKEARVAKDLLIKKFEGELERLREESDRQQQQLEKKDEQLRQLNRDVHQLQGQVDQLKDRVVDPMAGLTQRSGQGSTSLEALVLEMKDKMFQLQ